MVVVSACITKSTAINLWSTTITSCGRYTSSVVQHFDSRRCNNCNDYCLLCRVSLSETIARLLCDLGSYILLS